MWGGSQAGPSFSATQIYRVSQITAYIKELFDSDDALQDLWLEGEVSNYSRAASGHVYFTLKDEEAQIRCVMWRSQVGRQAYLPQNGEAIVAHGRISVYEAGGQYQLYVDDIQPAGAGLLYLQFEALKERLAAEGFFDAERKRPLPSFPQRLGVVTSPSAAALRDIVNVLRRRYPLIEMVLSPTLVQGDEAPPQIVAAIEALNEYAEVDVIIVARGGGSLEDLWAFNDERVARAICASQVPVITGVGHETDFTIADFVADVRAPTPSAAAEVVVPDRQELRGTVESWRERLAQLMKERIEKERRTLQYREQALRRFSPQAQIDSYRQRMDDLMHSALASFKHRFALAREQLRTLDSQLQALGPLATLERGYAIAKHLGTGKVVRSIAQVVVGDRLEVRVSNGQFESTVDRT